MPPSKMTPEQINWVAKGFTVELDFSLSVTSLLILPKCSVAVPTCVWFPCLLHLTLHASWPLSSCMSHQSFTCQFPFQACSCMSRVQNYWTLCESQVFLVNVLEKFLWGGESVAWLETLSMWLDESRKEPPTEQNNPKTSIETGNLFSHLDTELVWATNGNLQFRVHLKPNQQLKHLNADGIHTKARFKAMPSGVYKRLSKLTTITETNKNLPLDKICPQRFQLKLHNMQN